MFCKLGLTLLLIFGLTKQCLGEEFQTQTSLLAQVSGTFIYTFALLGLSLGVFGVCGKLVCFWLGFIFFAVNPFQWNPFPFYPTPYLPPGNPTPAPQPQPKPTPAPKARANQRRRQQRRHIYQVRRAGSGGWWNWVCTLFCGVIGWYGSPNLVTRKSACKPSRFRKVRVVRPRWSSRRVNLAVNYGPAQPGGGWRLSAGTPPTLFPTTVSPDQVGPPRAEPALPVVSSPSYPPHPPSKFECVGVGVRVKRRSAREWPGCA